MTNTREYDNNQGVKPTANVYPQITAVRIENPNRWYAFPFIGGIVKAVELFPVFIVIAALGAVNIIILIINSFFVLFTGKYWHAAYEFNLGLLRLSAKITFFWKGMTNKYPGFSWTIDDAFTIDIPYPQNPNRLFAIPIFGLLARIILLIPYFIYSNVISNAANIATAASSLAVLFNGYYPETTFELNRDSFRVQQAAGMYIAGMSDMYPNFWISMNHKNMKIFLIILGALWLIFGNISRSTNTSTGRNQFYRSISPTPESINTY